MATTRAYMGEAAGKELLAKLINYITDKLSELKANAFQVVSELPEEGEAGVCYLVLNAGQEEGNLYDEYVYENGAWEKLGQMHLDPDLSEYVNEVTAVGSEPLSLAVTKNGNVLNITGSVAQATENNDGYMTAEQVQTLNELSDDSLSHATEITAADVDTWFE
ncbi:MAG: hypothetical protein LUI09_05725 [Prevotellaceae bacterium]|nr:hypothetical protein [Prevotellaceae bacterium]